MIGKLRVLHRARRGRPRVPEAGYVVQTWLRRPEHAQLVQVARARGITVSAVVRGIVEQSIRRK
jgi:hypothetical protein